MSGESFFIIIQNGLPAVESAEPVAALAGPYLRVLAHTLGYSAQSTQYGIVDLLSIRYFPAVPISDIHYIR
jgi:hypothetical protein